MKENEQNFGELKKLLKFKRQEIPPPGYFNNFSDKVVARLRADEISSRGSAYEQLQSHSPWVTKFLALFEAKPSVIGAFATGLCVLLVMGVIMMEKSETSATSLMADTSDATISTMPLASVTSPVLADAGGGIQITTNSVSLQPMASLFGQRNPLLQSASFGH